MVKSAQVRRTRLFGRDLLVDGLAPNLTVQALGRYPFEQGPGEHELDPCGLFAPRRSTGSRSRCRRREHDPAIKEDA